MMCEELIESTCDMYILDLNCTYFIASNFNFDCINWVKLMQ